MDAKCPNRPKERKFVQVLYREQAGQECAEDANRPNRANWKNLSQTALKGGHLGQMDAKDANRPVWPK
ncbi:hypothetical protein KI387_014183 [Taxus chinensis]|uniref:Uncharacterized protein n=1 Tax=Taxus chinensis TaxID=29808 RepID=A0AA38CLW5_TAXCH|nr:hypothetical protein KI387_014183 [Taxus chinensis]